MFCPLQHGLVFQQQWHGKQQIESLVQRSKQKLARRPLTATKSRHHHACIEDKGKRHFFMILQAISFVKPFVICAPWPVFLQDPSPDRPRLVLG
jgi:hypothetical protein